jgi:hypothetical protein
MRESDFVSIFESVASEVMGSKALIERKANLFYQLTLNRELELDVKDTKSPARGASAFQTDICIFELLDGIKFPRVVIEFKMGISSHDILTYSTKAGKHKKIYPCLRYGLLASELEFIPNRFFIHNENLDFFIAAKNYKSEADIRPFAKKLIEKELEISRTLEQIHFDNRKFDYYRTDIIFGKFGDS